MKFYAINSSPRKNFNTAKILDSFLEGIKSVDYGKAEYKAGKHA